MGAECAMGFCFYNNVALAALAALRKGCRRVLIFDWVSRGSPAALHAIWRPPQHHPPAYMRCDLARHAAPSHWSYTCSDKLLKSGLASEALMKWCRTCIMATAPSTCWRATPGAPPPRPPPLPTAQHAAGVPAGEDEARKVYDKTPPSCQPWTDGLGRSRTVMGRGRAQGAVRVPAPRERLLPRLRRCL